jgi:hypothetical protein
VEWKGSTYTLDRLPSEVGPGPAAAAETWADWVVEHDYRMHLSANARVLLIRSPSSGEWERQLELIGRTSVLFDELVPLPKRDADPPVGDGRGVAAGGADGAPEDSGVTDSASGEYSYSYTWGAGTWPLETETCVMFAVSTEADYAAVLARLGELEPYLRHWVESAGRFTGFVLEKPLIGAYIEQASGQNEWDPENEVVHRVAEMLLVRRFAQLPFWLVQGLAWHVEMELTGGLYCFPYRSEFVSATEHVGWEADLGERLRKGERGPLRLEEIAGWDRGRFEEGPAKLAYGLVRFLARHHRPNLSAFVEQLRLFRDEHSRVDLGNGGWERKTNYRIPDEELMSLLQAHFRGSVLDDATDFLRQGTGFRLSKE